MPKPRPKVLRLDIYPPDDLWLVKLDEWIRHEGSSPLPTRAQAIRRMVEERVAADETKRQRKIARQ